MPKKERELVENPSSHENIETARNLPDAANSEQSMQGYAAINGLDEDAEIAREAYKMFQERGNDDKGDADGDWFRAEAEVRRKRQNP
jgi:hypothetical protein